MKKPLVLGLAKEIGKALKGPDSFERRDCQWMIAVQRRKDQRRHEPKQVEESMKSNSFNWKLMVSKTSGVTAQSWM